MRGKQPVKTADDGGITLQTQSLKTVSNAYQDSGLAIGGKYLLVTVCNGRCTGFSPT